MKKILILGIICLTVFALAVVARTTDLIPVENRTMGDGTVVEHDPGEGTTGHLVLTAPHDNEDRGYPWGLSSNIVKEDKEKFDKIWFAGKTPRLKEVPRRSDFTWIKVVGVDENKGKNYSGSINIEEDGQ